MGGDEGECRARRDAPLDLQKRERKSRPRGSSSEFIAYSDLTPDTALNPPAPSLHGVAQCMRACVYLRARVCVCVSGDVRPVELVRRGVRARLCLSKVVVSRPGIYWVSSVWYLLRSLGYDKRPPRPPVIYEPAPARA